MEHLEAAYTLYTQWLEDAQMELLAQAAGELAKDFLSTPDRNFEELIKLLKQPGSGDKTAAASAIRAIRVRAALGLTSESDAQKLKQLAEAFSKMAFPAT